MSESNLTNLMKQKNPKKSYLMKKTKLWLIFKIFQNLIWNKVYGNILENKKNIIMTFVLVKVFQMKKFTKMYPKKLFLKQLEE